MLQEKRYSRILELLKVNKTMTIKELSDGLGASESTIRRDLDKLDKLGSLSKVYGGAKIVETQRISSESNVQDKSIESVNEKIAIAKYAASLIVDGDFVFIDAGTTTMMMVEYINDVDAIFVTNGLLQANLLSTRNFTVFVIGGKLKNNTLAIVGSNALLDLEKYNYTKAFLGANGVDLDQGVTTPEIDESVVKESVIDRAVQSYILVDPTKFDVVSNITFSNINDHIIITTEAPSKYKKLKNIIEVK